MTIYRTFLSRGYFPKELPPAFFTERFADYATTLRGRTVLASYKPANDFTECVSYNLALPGLNHRRLRIPHPASFALLAILTAKHFRRLLKKAGGSPFSKSRPVYSQHQHRALRTLVKPTNLARERATARAGAAFLLKVDVSQFYPSLYTHAVGWAIDPKLRQRVNWRNSKLLGKKLDDHLMNMQGRVSQGIPIGNDISFLLAEAVLAQIDRALKLSSARCYRWFDDYEIACNTRREAEETLTLLNKQLDLFRLRLNPQKTKIIELPQAAGNGWQEALIDSSKSAFASPSNMVRYFDTAFRLREQYPDAPVLMYAIGALFKIRQPKLDVRRVADSCITQALLCEPGSAQKAFALLTFWEANGSPFDRGLIAEVIERLVVRHEVSGVSSDVAWALAFCIQQRVPIRRNAGKILSLLEDDAVAIQSLHAHSLGLLPGFNKRAILRNQTNANADGEHWLLIYEAVRQGFLPALSSVASKSSLFADLLANKVTFYRAQLPTYAMLVHPGGAPEWVVQTWIKDIQSPPHDKTSAAKIPPVVNRIGSDLEKVAQEEKSAADLILELLNSVSTDEFVSLESYA